MTLTDGPISIFFIIPAAKGMGHRIHFAVAVAIAIERPPHGLQFVQCLDVTPQPPDPDSEQTRRQPLFIIQGLTPYRRYSLFKG